VPIIKTSREQIIKDAIHLFKVHGYFDTTMSDIAQSCGLIKGSIYHHFGSKEELGLECLKYIHEYFSLNIFSIAYLHNFTDSEKLKRFTYSIEQYFLKSEGGCLLGNLILQSSNNMPAFRAEIESYFHDWESALTAILLAGFGKSLAEKTSREIVASTQGCIMMMRLYGKSETFKTMNNKVCQLLA
jgi:TetR/AcrR family transcriptional repressor of lmrAB and yxaGH operons